MDFNPIGEIRTPHRDSAPFQPPREGEGDFRLEVDMRWAPGLRGLERFHYIMVFYLLDRAPKASPIVHPPWTPQGYQVGLFATRSPARPNPIGFSVVRVRKVEWATIHTSPLDALDRTPLLDIKPYLLELDTRLDANTGWVEDMPDPEHLRMHVLGIPH